MKKTFEWKPEGGVGVNFVSVWKCPDMLEAQRRPGREELRWIQGGNSVIRAM